MTQAFTLWSRRGAWAAPQAPPEGHHRRETQKASRWFGAFLALTLATGWANSVRAGFTESIVQPQFNTGSSTIESINGFTINGTPTLFYEGFLPNQASFVFESQLINGTWSTSKVVSSGGFFGATVVNGTPYVGYSTSGVFSAGVATILSQNGNGGWSTEYQSPTPQYHLGDSLTMGVYNNQPIAVFAGPYPPSGAYSPNETMVEKTGPSTWQATVVPVPYNAGFFHFSPVQFGNKLEILGSTYGGFGDLLMTRTGGYGGAWTSQFYNFNQDSSGNLANVDGTPSFFSSLYPSNSYYSTISDGTLHTTEVKPGGNSGFAVGSDLQVINGIPTIAFLDRSDGKLHLDQLINGSFTDQVLTSGNASWTQAVSVFQAPNGDIAVAAIIEKGSTSQVEYFTTASLPEPGPISFAGLAALGLLLRRSRRCRLAAPLSNVIGVKIGPPGASCRRGFRSVGLLAACIACAALPAGARADVAGGYHAAELFATAASPPNGNPQTVVSGQLVAASPNNHALWQTSPTNAVDLHPSFGSFSRSFASGTDGHTQVGYGLGGRSHAILWNGTAASAVDLHPTNLSGFTDSVGMGVYGNQQVGYGAASGFSHALLWTGSGSTARDLKPTNLSNIADSVAFSTDGMHQVGYGRYQSGNISIDHAMMWTGTANSAVDLSLASFTSYSYAYGTFANQEVGYGYGSSLGNGHALLWSGSASSMVDLSPTNLAGFNTTVAYGTNGSQQVGYGFGSATDNQSNALVWSGTASSAVNLHTLLPSNYVSSIAYSVDSTGDIFGTAVDSAGTTHVVEWVANVPEPSSAVLLLSAVMIYRIPCRNSVARNSGTSPAIRWRLR